MNCVTLFEGLQNNACGGKFLSLEMKQGKTRKKDFDKTISNTVENDMSTVDIPTQLIAHIVHTNSSAHFHRR